MEKGDLAASVQTWIRAGAEVSTGLLLFSQCSRNTRLPVMVRRNPTKYRPLLIERLCAATGIEPPRMEPTPTERRRFRDDFPFLRDPDCPAELKILATDKITTHEHRANLEMLVAQLLDPLRDEWAQFCDRQQLGTPAITVSSGYRGFRLNTAVGGSKTLAHCVGYAADLVPANGRLAEFKRFCRDWLKGRPFDQMISKDENNRGVPRWIHIGYKNQQGGHAGSCCRWLTENTNR